MKWIKLFEEFQMGDLNFMSPEEIQKLFMDECKKKTPDINLIRVIVENGLVDVNGTFDYGRFPLACVVRWNNVNNVDLVDLVELFISAGADVNAKDVDGESPLAEAVREGYVGMQDLLKKHGAIE